MRFGSKFQRRVNGALSIPVLGSDSAPVGHPTSKATESNQFSCKLNNINGFPVQRIAVGYSGPVSALGLPATLFIWDDLSEIWFKAATKTMQPGVITWFDQPTLSDMVSGSAGSLEVALVVSSGGADPDGTYTFVMGADLSNTT